jgi:hypothetical protein
VALFSKLCNKGYCVVFKSGILQPSPSLFSSDFISIFINPANSAFSMINSAEVLFAFNKVLLKELIKEANLVLQLSKFLCY